MIRNRLRVVMYVRVSSKEQVDGYSIGEQIERLEKYADAMDWDIVKVFVDPGYSGGNTDRPGLKEMIKEIEKGGIDKVVVYKLDRLSRSQLDTLYLIEKVFLANNTDFVSMSENFDTSTPFGRAMIGILAVFAQLEREQIKERMGMGKEARAKEGKWGGGAYHPIGYTYNKDDDLLEIDKYEAMQIRELFELFLKGTPVRTIARIFDEKGYTHKYGKWDARRMKRILKNRDYLGYIKYRDTYYKADHDPIISEDIFEQAQELLRQRKEQYEQFNQRTNTQTTYLGGLLYCKRCGGKYCKTRGGSARYGYIYYYSCYSRNKKVKEMVKDPNCKNKNWKVSELDSIVLNEIQKLSIDPEYINTLREKPVNTESSDTIRIIEDQLLAIDNQISRFMDLYGIGKFTIEQVSKKIDPLNEKRSALEKELNKLNEERGAISEEKALEIIESFEDVIEAGDFDEIRLVIESLIYNIELDEDNVYIHWKFA